MLATEEQVDVQDATLWTTRSGTGLPLLLCHGGPGQWDYFEPVAQLIDDLVTVHRYDQRGCGRSTGRGPLSVARYVEDMETLRRHFGYARWIVGGHSWGATLALACAWAHPGSVDALIYISGTGLGSEWHQAYREEGMRRLTAEQRDRYLELRSLESRSAEEELEYLSIGTSRDYADRDVALTLARRHYETGFAVNYEANRTIGAEINAWQETNSIEKCRSLSLPVLIMVGSEDPRPTWAGDSLCEALPNVRRIVIEGAGHNPWVEKPDEFKAALRSFLEEVTRDC